MNGLKILHLVEATNAGVGKHVLDLSRGLLSLGHVITVAYGTGREDAQFSSGIEHLARYQDVEILPISIPCWPTFEDVPIAAGLRRVVRRRGVDVIHCHSTKAGFLGRLGLWDLAPVVYTPHAMLTMSPCINRITRTLAACLEWGLAPLSDRIIAVSDEERMHIERLNISPKKISVVHNGIECRDSELDKLQRSRYRREWRLRSDEICLGFVGRLTPQKALDDLLQALAILNSRRNAGRPVRLAIVGDGPLGCSSKELAKRLQVESSLLWLGARCGAEVMPAFDVFVLPSRYESFPYVMLEAMGAGLPIVAAKVGGVTTLVEHGVNGLLIDPGDYMGLANALETLVSDESSRAAMGRRSAELAPRYTLQRMVDETVRVYDEVLLNSAPRSARHLQPQSAITSCSVGQTNQTGGIEEVSGRRAAVGR